MLGVGDDLDDGLTSSQYKAKSGLLDTTQAPTALPAGSMDQPSGQPSGHARQSPEVLIAPFKFSRPLEGEQSRAGSIRGPQGVGRDDDYQPTEDEAKLADATSGHKKRKHRAETPSALPEPKRPRREGSIEEQAAGGPPGPESTKDGVAEEVSGTPPGSENSANGIEEGAAGPSSKSTKRKLGRDGEVDDAAPVPKKSKHTPDKIAPTAGQGGSKDAQLQGASSSTAQAPYTLPETAIDATSSQTQGATGQSKPGRFIPPAGRRYHPKIGDPELLPRDQLAHDYEWIMQPRAIVHLRCEPTVYLNTDQLKRELDKVYFDLDSAVNWALKSIGPVNWWCSALVADPSESLLALYKKCWGSKWREFRSKLTIKNFFGCLQATMSMISAFIFDHVLNQEPSVDDIREKLASELSGVNDEVKNIVLQQFEGEEFTSNYAHIIRTTNTRKANALLDEGNEAVQAKLQAEAEAFAHTLWTILAPHFRAVEDMMKSFGEFTGATEESWLERLMSIMTDSIRLVLFHRLRLHATGCEHAYTWQNPGDKYVITTMEIDCSETDTGEGRDVLYTVWPGLEVTLPNDTGKKDCIRSRIIMFPRHMM